MLFYIKELIAIGSLKGHKIRLKNHQYQIPNFASDMRPKLDYLFINIDLLYSNFLK